MIRDTADVSSWRPQQFGRRAARHIQNPVIEPLWVGRRALAHFDDHGARLVDASGVQLQVADLEEAVVEAARSVSFVIDGYLSAQARESSVGVFPEMGGPNPTPGQVARQMLVGDRSSERREAIRALTEPTPMPDPDADVAFVAIDLLLLDDEPLLDVPLLERKRLLESVVAEGPLIRCGIHIRPPIDPWLGTWRAFGFQELAWKNANSRYRPGERNDDWATSRLPQSR